MAAGDHPGGPASIALLTTDNSGLEVFALGGNQAIAIGAVIPLEGSVGGQVCGERRTIKVDDNSVSPGSDTRMLTAGGLMSSVHAPLMSASECFGVLTLAHSDKAHFSRSEAADAEALGWFIGSFIRLHRQQRRLQRLSDLDAMTGLYNRSAFNRFGAEAWRAFAEEGAPFALALLDVDNLRSLNGHHGHDHGDEIIRTVSAALRVVTRRHDVIARVGGEEFAIVFTGLSLSDGAGVAELLRRRVASTAGRIPGVAPHTVSAGVVVAELTDRSFDTVYRRADRALIAAKREGRNTVVSLNSVDDRRAA